MRMAKSGGFPQELTRQRSAFRGHSYHRISSRSVELHLRGDELVKVFSAFAQYVFGLEPETVVVLGSESAEQKNVRLIVVPVK